MHSAHPAPLQVCREHADRKATILSVFGPAGSGKSHLLNLLGASPPFPVSPRHDQLCTKGILISAASAEQGRGGKGARFDVDLATPSLWVSDVIIQLHTSFLPNDILESWEWLVSRAVWARRTIQEAAHLPVPSGNETLWRDSEATAAPGGGKHCILVMAPPPGAAPVDEQVSIHPGGNPWAKLKSISHRCHPILVACVRKMTQKNINLPLGCLQGGMEVDEQVQGYLAHKKLPPPGPYRRPILRALRWS